MTRRRSGILLHPTSLPGPHGIGDLGAGAQRFVEWLARARQRVWQVLPLGPTGFGDSPYQSLSSFAGNPLLVSLATLRDEGWLADADLADAPDTPDAVDYARVIPWKAERLRRAARRFAASAPAAARSELEAFRQRERAWLDDFALFVTLKEAHGGRAWPEWAPELAARDPDALAAARARHADAIFAAVFAQWAFRRQWDAVRARCRALGIAVLGDLPIYVAHDGVEVWSHPKLFQLDGRGAPAAVAGVPPDYFSATGQLWGNPLYAWDAHRADGFAWWRARVRATLALFDEVRLDHFRGLEAYWSVPAGAPDARAGRWIPAPGAELLDALRADVGPLPFVAENLGVITPEVEALRDRYGLPGMAVLQFAFGDDPQAESFKPHNYLRNLVAYTGTHDNDTALGWWDGGGGDSVRSDADVEREKAFARAYLATDGREPSWTLIRTVQASVADTAIAPLQDVLGLGSEARMNRPSTASGNWRWRVREAALRPELAERLARFAVLYGRAPA